MEEGPNKKRKFSRLTEIRAPLYKAHSKQANYRLRQYRLAKKRQNKNESIIRACTLFALRML